MGVLHESSADELRQMLAFAQSPAGRHLISRFAALENDEALPDAQMQVWEALTPIIEDVQRELCAERAAVQVAAGNVDAKCPLSEPAALAG